MKRVYWDTMLFAYWLEDSAEFGHRVRAIYRNMLSRQCLLCGSAFALAELLVVPVKQGNANAQRAIERFFDSELVTMLDIDPSTSRIFAELRAFHRLKPMDAFHLSIAAAAGVDVFLTNDRRLHSVRHSGLPIIASLDTDIF